MGAASAVRSRLTRIALILVGVIALAIGPVARIHRAGRRPGRARVSTRGLFYLQTKGMPKALRK